MTNAFKSIGIVLTGPEPAVEHVVCLLEDLAEFNGGVLHNSYARIQGPQGHRTEQRACIFAMPKNIVPAIVRWTEGIIAQQPEVRGSVRADVSSARALSL